MNNAVSPRRRKPGPSGNAWAMGIGMLVLLVAVIFALFRLIPLAKPGEISNWNARKLLRQADSLMRTAGRVNDAAPFLSSAEGIYRQVARGRAIKPAYRLKAAAGLESLAAKLPEKIEDIHATLAELDPQLTASRDREKFVPLKVSVDATWESAQREAKLDAQADAQGADQQTVQTQSTETAPPPSPTPPSGKRSAGRVIARVGGEDVTDDEILYAWQAMNGDDLPTSETLRLFVFKYLNMNLLANEARRRGLENDPRTALDLKINRIGALGEALDRDLAARQPKIADAVLRAYYDGHRAEFARAAQAAQNGSKGAPNASPGGSPNGSSNAAGDAGFDSARESVRAVMEREALLKARAALLQSLRGIDPNNPMARTMAAPQPLAAQTPSAQAAPALATTSRAQGSPEKQAAPGPEGAAQ